MSVLAAPPMLRQPDQPPAVRERRCTARSVPTAATVRAPGPVPAAAGPAAASTPPRLCQPRAVPSAPQETDHSAPSPPRTNTYRVPSGSTAGYGREVAVPPPYEVQPRQVPPWYVPE